MATLFSTEAAEIVVPLENENLRWFHVPGFTGSEGPGSTAKAHARIAGRELSWDGQVVRAEGKLDERTRMINVVVRVDEPYATRPPLAMGLFVTVDIKGRQLPEGAVIPRRALQEDDMVWVVDGENRLRFRKIDVACVQGDQVVVEQGLRDGERVVITPLKVVTDGMAIRPAGQEEDSPS